MFNDGDMKRDFTYIDDIVPGVIAALDSPPDAASGVPHRLYNIGNRRPESLMRLIAVLEDSLGLKAEINFRPLQPGDVKETCADIAAIQRDLGYAPTTPIDGRRSAFRGLVQGLSQHRSAARHHRRLTAAQWRARQDSNLRPRD